MVVDATVHPAPGRVGFRIPGLATSVSEYEPAEGDLRHRDFDELLDLDPHDCIRGASFCYLCAVQEAQQAGRRV